MSLFFVNRPKFAWVIAFFISLAGLLVIPALPVTQYPHVAPPEITVSATYPGASAQILADSVSSVIEEELNGIEGLLYFESTSSSNGTVRITVTFQPGTDPELAQVQVQNRVSKAQGRLPRVVLDEGVQVEKGRSNFLMVYAFTFKGDTVGDTAALADYVARHINNEIRRVPGVGSLRYFDSEAAMRVWVNPHQLASHGLSSSDVNAAIRAQNVHVPAGSFGASPNLSGQELTATLVVKGTLDTPEAFGRIVLRANNDGSTVTLGDVARIELGSQAYNFTSRQNGKPGVGAAVQLAPKANAITTAAAVKSRLAELSVNFPEGVELTIPFDDSVFVALAIEKVVYTLFEAMVLVFLVMFLFLQSVRYTLIPAIVVPVCLLGTFAVMQVMGFSVNMMSMFGMVLAIGILVDDAIVVVENVERIMVEEGLTPVAATVKAMNQVSGAIVGITLVLSAVFLPLAFMSGSVGIIYQQFSVSLAVSILLSGFLALTFTPALCATLLKPVAPGHVTKKGVFGAFNRGFTRLTDGYVSLCSRTTRRAGRFMIIYLALVGLFAFLYLRLPESFVPSEDRGYMIIDVQLAPGATRQRTSAAGRQVEDFLLQRDAIASTYLVLGNSLSGTGENAAFIHTALKDWSMRGDGQSVESEIAALNEHFSHANDATILSVNPPPVEGMGTTSGFALRLQDRAGLGREALIAAREQLLEGARDSRKIGYAKTDGLPEAPQLRLVIDREKALALGVGFEAINQALATFFGSSVMGDFASAGRQQRVIVQAEHTQRMTPESVLELQVPGTLGQPVPLAAFTTLQWEEGPVQIVRYNGYPSFNVSGAPPPGASSGEAMAEIERLASELPKGIGYEWTGLSYQENLASGQSVGLFGLALLVVFLILVALYESWTIPLAVMLVVPIGALGAVMAVTAAGLTNDVYFKVGLVTIIGLATKNAILIIEFAEHLRARGLSLRDATVEAARQRFRPIVMTSVAFILGVLPLVLATGAGSASQRAIGTGVLGGMLSATLLGVIFVPVLFVWVLSHLRRRVE